ncbi:MAG: hypothetical protein U0169_06060 [Polyangiaceae bacterium]
MTNVRQPGGKHRTVRKDRSSPSLRRALPWRAFLTVALAMVSVATFGCSSQAEEATSNVAASTDGADEGVCGDMTRAAVAAKQAGSILDFESEFEDAVDKERQVLDELVVRSANCDRTKDAPGCQGLDATTADEYTARRKALAACKAPANPGTSTSTSTTEVRAEVGISASKACEKVAGKSDVFLNASCEVSRTRLLAVLESNAVRVCDALAKVGTAKPSKSAATVCGADVIKQVCGFFAGVAANTVNQTDKASDALGRMVGTGAAQAVTKSFVSTALECLKAKGTEAIAEVLTEATEGAAKNAFKDSLTKASAVGLVLATTACTVASNQVADAISTSRDVDYDNACSASAFSFKSKHRIAACMKTAGGACAAFGGTVNVGDIAGLDPASTEAFFANVASAGISATCTAGGPATRILCGTINQAALQIKQAFTTGTNDWATCIPTAQLGACIGTLYANWESGGWSNNEGVATSRGTGEDEVRDCCWCYKDTYQDDGYFSDTRLSRENWFGVIQKGDFESGNCAWMENKGIQNGGVQMYTDSGYAIYYRYAECGKVTVKGGSCKPGDSGTMTVVDGASGGTRTVPAIPY